MTYIFTGITNLNSENHPEVKTTAWLQTCNVVIRVVVAKSRMRKDSGYLFIRLYHVKQKLFGDYNQYLAAE